MECKASSTEGSSENKDMSTMAAKSNSKSSQGGSDKEQRRVSRAHDQRWEEMYQRLQEFKRSTGHCRVPNRYADDPQLGSWVSAQRRQYRIVTQGEEGSAALTPERANRLIALGFEWSTTNPHHTPWETRYKSLREFVQRFGHAEVPMRWDRDPKLSHWVSKQRHDYKLRLEGKTSRLNDEKVRLLNEIGFRWEGTRRSVQKKVQEPRVAGLAMASELPQQVEEKSLESATTSTSPTAATNSISSQAAPNTNTNANGPPTQPQTSVDGAMAQQFLSLLSSSIAAPAGHGGANLPQALAQVAAPVSALPAQQAHTTNCGTEALLRQLAATGQLPAFPPVAPPQPLQTHGLQQMLMSLLTGAPLSTLLAGAPQLAIQQAASQPVRPTTMALQAATQTPLQSQPMPQQQPLGPAGLLQALGSPTAIGTQTPSPQTMAPQAAPSPPAQPAAAATAPRQAIQANAPQTFQQQPGLTQPAANGNNIIQQLLSSLVNTNAPPQTNVNNVLAQQLSALQAAHPVPQSTTSLGIHPASSILLIIPMNMPSVQGGAQPGLGTAGATSRGNGPLGTNAQGPAPAASAASASVDPCAVAGPSGHSAGIESMPKNDTGPTLGAL